MDSKRLAQYCCAYADNRKAQQPVILDLRNISSLTDFFIILSGSSAPHLKAIAEEIMQKLKEDHDIRPHLSDGKGSGQWVVLDYYDVIIHVMSEDTRARYDLEGLWGDAPESSPESPEAWVKRLLPILRHSRCNWLKPNQPAGWVIQGCPPKVA